MALPEGRPEAASKLEARQRLPRWYIRAGQALVSARSRRLSTTCSEKTVRFAHACVQATTARLPCQNTLLCMFGTPLYVKPYIACERTRNGSLTPSESTERTPCLAASSHLCHFLCVRSKSAIASLFMPDQELDIPGQFGHDRRARMLASPPFALPAARAEKANSACMPRDAHDAN